MDENKSGLIRRFFGFFTAVIVGGAIGSILGLTLAPKKGKEMRAFLKEQSHDLYEKSRSLFHANPKKISPLKRLLIKALMPKPKEDNDDL